MEEITFYVQGSAPEPYRVTFIRNGGNLSAYCTCRAGENGMYCKHRFQIMEGLTDDIVSDNTTEVQTVSSWLPGTDVGTIYADVVAIEREIGLLKRRLAKLKKDLAQAMRD
ncbi:MAG: hypothetical protein U5S82_14095 [Gammaproteobacteria bacterium]|nr:hypothetical protein [Gammaproteobacteria bacterium]